MLKSLRFFSSISTAAFVIASLYKRFIHNKFILINPILIFLSTTGFTIKLSIPRKRVLYVQAPFRQYVFLTHNK